MVAARARVALPVLNDSRPRTRAECVDGPRPCPWVSCVHHLLDIRERGGTRNERGRIFAADFELRTDASRAAAEQFTDSVADHVVSMTSTCALDIAERGESTHLEIGQMTGVSHERIRQLESKGLRRITRKLEVLTGEVAVEQPRCGHSRFGGAAH
ncbi:MAG TPA: sigma factor-like helix-turn-helix DNA-binding protein [Kofleriaceae bacterium]